VLRRSRITPALALAACGLLAASCSAAIPARSSQQRRRPRGDLALGHRHWRALGRSTSRFPLTADVRLSLALLAPGGSPGLAWVSVFDQLSCAMHGCATALLHSADGGRSWRPVPRAPRRSA
jgi:photosystem II stability/assembly factor-like uncharacterized protein